MKVDLDRLRAAGVSADAYKEFFTQKPEARSPELKRLYDEIRERIRMGREMNLRDGKYYAAVDMAFETPLNQTTPTIIQNILSHRLSQEETIKKLEDWGIPINEVFLRVEDPNTGKYKLVLNPPVFFQVLIPVVKAYCSIRIAKLFNDRNLVPLLMYSPLKQSDEDRVASEIVTDVIQTISTWMGYSNTLRELIQYTVKYGIAMAFPREEWYCERQLIGDGKEPKTIKEGLRYVFPHPSRLFYDMQYPLTTINSDTGVSYAGYWEVIRFAEILENEDYWNRDQITPGTNWFNHKYGKQFFAQIYPCTMSPPRVFQTVDDNLRESRMVTLTSLDRDQPVFLTYYFAKIVPSKYKLADYEYPVWHRFIVANDDVILWAGPVAYTPLWFAGYDYDPAVGVQPSMALETIPFQDHIGNLLTQIILTARQNLANIIYYDKNLVAPEDIARLENMGELKYRSLNFVPFDSLKLARTSLDRSQAFHPIQLPKVPTSELFNTINIMLTMMERMLQMSAQELGSTGPHYQSAREVMLVHSNTSNRLQYTGSFIDDAIAAWKQQIYDAAMAYMDASIVANVSDEIPNVEEVLANLGFKIEGRTKGRITVSGKKDALQLVGFARPDNMEDRTRNQELAQVIYQTIGVLAGNEALFAKVGAENILKLLEEAARLAGAPAKFRLPVLREETKTILQQVQELLAQQQQALTEQVLAPITQQVAAHEQALASIGQVLNKLSQIYQVAEAQQQRNQILAAKTAHDMQLEAALAQAEEARKNAEFEAEMQRKAAQAQLDAQLKVERAKADIAAKLAKAAPANPQPAAPPSQ